MASGDSQVNRIYRRLGPFADGVRDPGYGARGDAGPGLRALRNMRLMGTGALASSVQATQLINVTTQCLDPAGVACEAVLGLAWFKSKLVIVAQNVSGGSANYFQVYLFEWDPVAGTVTRKGLLWDFTITAGYVQNAPNMMGVTFAEGFGVLYIASDLALGRDPANATGLGPFLVAATRTWDGTTLADLMGDLGYGNRALYFLGVIGFQQHLWGWGTNGNTGVLPYGYQPDQIRYSGPLFSAFSANDYFTLGNRPQNTLENVVAAAVAGNELMVGGQGIISGITGSDRDTWVRRIVDPARGVVGTRSMLGVGAHVYAVSGQGVVRIDEGGAPVDISAGIEKVFYRTPALAQAMLCFDPRQNQLRVVLPVVGPVPNYTPAQDYTIRPFAPARSLVYDLEQQQWMGDRAYGSLSSAPLDPLSFEEAADPTYVNDLPLWAATLGLPPGPAGRITLAAVKGADPTTQIAVTVAGTINAGEIVNVYRATSSGMPGSLVGRYRWVWRTTGGTNTFQFLTPGATYRFVAVKSKNGQTGDATAAASVTLDP